MKLLQLKNAMFSVEQIEDGSLILICEDGSRSKDAGSIISNLGGVDATLLRCIDINESFESLVQKKLKQADIRRQRLNTQDEFIGPQTEKCKRGGWRGGGRPQKPKSEKRQQIYISLPPDVLSKLRNETESPSQFIEQVLRSYFDSESK